MSWRNTLGKRDRNNSTSKPRINAEELEDFRIVSERLAKPFGTISNDEVWRKLGLADEAIEDKSSR
jgi:hypothetical protein